MHIDFKSGVCFFLTGKRQIAGSHQMWHNTWRKSCIKKTC